MGKHCYIMPYNILGDRNPNVYNPKAAGLKGFNIASTKQNWSNFAFASEYYYEQKYYGENGRGTKGIDKERKIRIYYQW